MLRSEDLSAYKMQSFSVRQKLQPDRVHMYVVAHVTIDQLIEKSVLLSFRSHILYLDKTGSLHMPSGVSLDFVITAAVGTV